MLKYHQKGSDRRSSFTAFHFYKLYMFSIWESSEVSTSEERWGFFQDSHAPEVYFIFFKDKSLFLDF